ncbi:MAG TPA: hypothetical protein VGX28_12445 [Frankiaceae bacterium]|jgi:hypothetical protein|nr:hypothetical protein [Frankiaceae bacterium]
MTDPMLPEPLAAARPFWRRHWVHVMAALVVGAGLGATTSTGSSSDGDADLRARLATAERRAREAEARPAPTVTVYVTPSASPTTRPPSPTPRPSTNPRLDEGWEAQSLTAGCEYGDWSGTARIRNTNADAHSASFTFTLFRGGKVIGSLQGFANGVETGRTVTVQLVSNDPCSKGAYTYEFQTDASF